MTAPLAGLRVVDVSTVLAGPNCARYLADFGADVVKVERAGTGDSCGTWHGGTHATAEGMWWKLANRNKRTSTSTSRTTTTATCSCACSTTRTCRGELPAGALERLGLGPDVLHARNPRLVITGLSGFGQTGPYAQRPGFASIAESMSGLAAVMGEPTAGRCCRRSLAHDELTGIVGAFATMLAIHARDVGNAAGGQVVDVNLLESVFQVMGRRSRLFALTGQLQQRLGSGLPYTVPRGTYRCRDGRWVGISASSDSVAGRVMTLLGLGDDPRFATFAGRVEHRDELESAMRDWCAARTRREVLAAFEEAEAAIGPVLDMADIAADPHFTARQAVVDVGGTPMQGLIARLSETPGELRWPGRRRDEDGDAIRRDGWGGSDLRQVARPMGQLNARAADAAVTTGVLRQVLLVVRLGVVEVAAAGAISVVMSP